MRRRGAGRCAGSSNDDADGNGNGVCAYGHARSHVDGGSSRAGGNSHGNFGADGCTHSHVYRHGNSQSDGHAYAGADADTHSETNGYPPTNLNAASDPDAHASADADTHSAPAGGAGNGAA